MYSGEMKSVFCVGHRDKEWNRPSSCLTNSVTIILLRNHGGKDLFGQYEGEQNISHCSRKCMNLTSYFI